ncbi:MAG TPA: protein-glutamate O-methyltransferase [Paenirhodobacter sp.]
MSYLRPHSESQQLSDENFGLIAEWLHTQSGVRLARTQRAMLQSRLLRRVRDLQLPDLDSYMVLLHSPDGDKEQHHMVSALTTHVSQFFREMHHFQLLRLKILPAILRQAQHGQPIRIWSAGCANGQEPYSIAMILADLVPDYATYDVQILATDIDPVAIAFAHDGIYPAAAIPHIPSHYRSRFIVRHGDGQRIAPSLRNLVTFQRQNLHDSWPEPGTFDLIFCRNVAIYFDKSAQRRLWQRFEFRLRPGGWLCLGHAERIPADIGSQLVPDGVTTYRLPPLTHETKGVLCP